MAWNSSALSFDFGASASLARMILPIRSSDIKNDDAVVMIAVWIASRSEMFPFASLTAFL